MEESMIVIRDTKTFCCDSNLPEYVDRNLKHEIELTIKSNESLAENEVKDDIEQLLLKCKHGNNIHKHGKQRNEWIT